MKSPGTNSEETAAVFVDLGTTNMRVYLARGAEVIARAKAQVGVRDTARDGSNTRLKEALKSLIAEVIGQGNGLVPTGVVAAGMITSSLGLIDVPHVPAPAGVAELAAGARRFQFPEVTPLPIFLVPGVRTGSLDNPRLDQPCDIMRGEETLCVGLLAQGLISAPSTVINLGSHWKTIQIDERGRIAESVTSLAGEMIHAVQTTTILASALPTEWPETLDEQWVLSAMTEKSPSGLSRTLFRVRLLELSKTTTPAQRMAYLVGAFIGYELDPLLMRGKISCGKPVALVGPAALAGAWKFMLKSRGISAQVITPEQTESALLAGLRTILAAR